MGRFPLVALSLALLVGGTMTKGMAKPKTRTAAPPDPAPPEVDIAPVRDVLEVFHDGKGHYLALVPWTHKLPRPLGAKQFVFYGDGKVFHRAYAPTGGSSRADYSFCIHDPRTIPGRSCFGFKDGAAEFRCETRKVALSKLDPVKETALVKQAKFRDRYWRRRPHALARDDDGNYYYVDEIGDSDELTRTPQGLRVFVGQRGRLRFLPMKNLVVDPAGEIFITADGRLKLVVDYESKNMVQKATWVAGKDRRPLTVIDLRGGKEIRARLFIYRELGVYAGIKLHLPCDDW